MRYFGVYFLKFNFDSDPFYKIPHFINGSIEGPIYVHWTVWREFESP
jgi:hypothetical protein